MTTVVINGKRVTVSDDFLSLSPEEQEWTIDEIAAGMGGPSAQTPRKTATPEETAEARARAEEMNTQSIDAMKLRPNTYMGAAGDALGAVGAGLSRGGMELLGLPGTIGDLGGNLITGGINMAFGTELEYPQSAISGRSIRGAASDLTGGATEYKGKTPLTKVGGTVGEFIGGGAGAKVGLIGGTASELAGQATEGTAIEPFARIAGGILAPMAASRLGAFAGGDEAAVMANKLKDSGVRNITVGQAKASPGLMRAEGRLQATAQQLDDYTATIMKQIGSPAKKATPSALLAAEQAIVKQMDDAVAGAVITPDINHAKGAAVVASRYAEMLPGQQIVPRIRGIANEIATMSRNGTPVSLTQLKEWRSSIGQMTVSADAATREAAHGLRALIDGMTDQALLTANRGADIAELAKGREAYRNYIGIRDAASRAGAEAGTLSPQALNQSVIRAQGREAYATGRSTPMSELTRAGAAVLRPAPAVLAGGGRSIQGGAQTALASAGAAAAYGAGGGPLGILASGLLGAAAPAIGKAAMRSGPIQSLMNNPGAFAAGVGRVSPGLLAQQEQQ